MTEKINGVVVCKRDFFGLYEKGLSVEMNSVCLKTGEKVLL